MHGHMTEQHNPPLMNANIDSLPVVSTPSSMASAPITLTASRVLVGFSWPQNMVTIKTAMQTTYTYKSLTSVPRSIFTPSITPNATSGTTMVAMILGIRARLNTEIAPIQRPIIRLPQ